MFAGAGALDLGVERDRLRHRQVGGPVDVDVAVAREMLEHRHPRLGADAADELLAPARDDDVDQVVHLLITGSAIRPCCSPLASGSFFLIRHTDVL